MPDLDLDTVAQILSDARGNVAASARALHVSRKTLYRRIKESKRLQDVLEDARETMLDNVESALYSAAIGGEAWAVCFYLKTQGKSRGYTERQEITGADGEPVQLTIVERIVDAAAGDGN